MESRSPPFTNHSSRAPSPLFPDRGRFLALAIAQVIQFGAPGATLFFDFHLRDTRRMDWKNAFHTLAVRDATDRESLVDSSPLTADHYPRENLDPFFIPFAHTGMHAHPVPHFELGDVGFLLLFGQGIDDVHKGAPAVENGAQYVAWLRPIVKRRPPRKGGAPCGPCFSTGANPIL